MNNKKKSILLLFSYFIILFTIKTKNNDKEIKYNDNFNIYTDNLYATYKDYSIYIKNISSINNEPENTKDIYIIDDRYSFDPDMSICNSYKINTLKEINMYLKLLTEYEKKYPSNWNRSINSMKNEWIIHNICYYLNHEKERTKQVDFDNSDELLYSNIINIINEISGNRLNELIDDNNSKLKRINR